MSDLDKFPGLVPGDVPYLTLPGLEAQPGLVHAIFTRHGGVSQAPFHALNASLSVGDDPDAVTENRRRIAEVLGIAPVQCQWIHQVHSNHVAVVTEHTAQAPEADALVTNRPGLLLCLRFADCVPVLLFDPVRRAVGIAHAGWRGTVKTIAAAMVHEMTRTFGTRPGDLWAGLGPAIAPCCYAVSRDLVESPGMRYQWPASAIQVREGVHYVDLWQANLKQLADAGVPRERIAVSGICTACHTADFYSHRAEQGRTGRFAVVIGLR